MDEFELGPKMRALTDRQRLFVMELVQDPTISGAEAARRAGYSDSSQAAKVVACNLRQDKRIIEAMHELAGRRLRGVALKAAHRVDQMLDSKDERVVLKAALGVFDRVGFGAQSTVNVNQTTTDLSGKAIMDKIAALGERLGVDTTMLLGRPQAPSAPVVDAEFSEVKDG